MPLEPGDPGYGLISALLAAHDAVIRDGCTANDVNGNTVDDLARALALLDEMLQRLHGIKQEVEDTLVASMEADDVYTRAGWLEREKRDARVTWKNADARDAAKAEFVRILATDRATGEVRPDWKRTVIDTFDLFTDVFSVSNPKAAFGRKLGLDPDEFRERDEATGYKVRLHPGPFTPPPRGMQ